MKETYLTRQGAMLQTDSACSLLDQNWMKPDLIEQAFQWLRKQRRFYSIHDATWTLSLHWPRIKALLLDAWRKGQHQFSPMKRHRLPTGSVAVFEAEDSLLLRKIVKTTHALMKQLQLTLHPDKTFIGKVEKGFSFSGYQITNKTLTINQETIKKHRTKLQQRYAQGASKKDLADYVHRFTRWCRAGMSGAPLWDEEKIRSLNNNNLDWINTQNSASVQKAINAGEVIIVGTQNQIHKQSSLMIKCET